MENASKKIGVIFDNSNSIRFRYNYPANPIDQSGFLSHTARREYDEI